MQRQSSFRNQFEAPLLAALFEHQQRAAARWHTPGHKGHWTDREWGRAIGEAALALDLTELEGLDNLHQPEGAIARAESLAAELYGGDRAFFLVNGASAGLQAVVRSLPGAGPVLLPRHAHRALVSGLVLSDRRPLWVLPDRVGPLQLPAGPRADTLRAALAESKPGLVVLIHPTYHGYTADLRAAIAVCHDAGVPVLVDAAHGAHLRFGNDLPPDPLAVGADAVVYSFHKTLGALTGAAVLIVQGQRLDPARIQAALTLLQTSSPSYLLLASLDAARREAAATASARLAALLPALQQARAELRASGLIVPDRSNLPPGFSHDPTKLLFSAAARGLTGMAMAEALRHRGIELEVVEATYALALVTPADDPIAVQELTRHITEVVGTEMKAAPASPDHIAGPGRNRLPPAVLSPAEAFRRRWQAVPLAEATDRVAAALVSVSPPGIAQLVPGELIEDTIVAQLQQAAAAGLVVQGLERRGDELMVMVVAN